MTESGNQERRCLSAGSRSSESLPPDAVQNLYRSCTAYEQLHFQSKGQ